MGTFKITYLHHSGFICELEDCILVFDYYMDPEGKLDDLCEVSSKPLYFFVSHFHADHFNPEINRFESRAEGYFIHRDCTLTLRNHEMLHCMEVGDFMVTKYFRIKMFGSTDAGGSFLINHPKASVFHAGDLNWWHWEEEDDAYNRMMRGDYQKEIETLTGEKIDLAFVVLDPRQEEQFYWGFDWYMRHTDTKIVFPMHMWKQYEVQDRLIGMEVSEPYREKIMRIREMGQVFEL